MWSVMDISLTTFDNAAVIARKYAVTCGLQPREKVGAIILIAGIAKALGAEIAIPILEKMGARKAKEFFASIPSVNEEEAAGLNALVPDEHLAQLLKGSLAPLLKDELPLENALEVLLDDKNLNDDTRKELAIVETAQSKKEFGFDFFDTRSLVRGLAKIYQKRFLLGRTYVENPNQEGLVDFVTGNSDDVFNKAYRRLVEDERKNWEATFDAGAYHRSLLGQVSKDYGKDAAHLVGALVLNEMGLVGDRPMIVRDLAYIADPKYFHLVIGKVKHEVATLADDGLVEIFPDDGEIRLFSKVLAAPKVVDDFLRFLDKNTAVTKDELEDILRVIV